MIKPLHVRKASSHNNFPQNQQASNDLDSHRGSSDTPGYPPRTSSTRSYDKPGNPIVLQSCMTCLKTPSTPEENSSFAKGEQNHPRSLTPMDAQVMDRHSGPSSLSNRTSQRLSETKSEISIMGDFVPIDSPNMAGLEPDMEPSTVQLQNGPRRLAVKINPYEFEPATPYDPSRQTTFTDFIRKGQGAEFVFSPKPGHVKNATSEGNAIYTTQNSASLAVTPNKANGRSLYRCESSPNINQSPFPSHQNARTSHDMPQYPMESQGSNQQGYLSRTEESNPRTYRDHGAKINHISRSPQRYYQDHGPESRSRSPTRRSPHASSTAYATEGNHNQSPTKALKGRQERDERNGVFYSEMSDSPPPSSPKKRSRSPMKKMFGEHGWLGFSPDEKPDPRLQPRKGVLTHLDFAGRSKKIGMMEKLKNKFEEMAEKADLNPVGRSRSNTVNNDKNRLSILTISLTPPDQARIYMELELMLVHTANSFLMTQFSQGRMDVDTIKKAVDSWKGKGRPLVIEFMYDQATQRDIVAANQQNFRFHGDKAGSDIRIDSMLYNWKQAASHMVIRTFCNADTVILKLLFDIEQVLELLGAGEPMMIRLQQIRATSTEMMRVARHNKDVKVTNQQTFRGRGPPRVSESSFGSSTPYNPSAEDSYGGLKLVPEAYPQ